MIDNHLFFLLFSSDKLVCPTFVHPCKLECCLVLSISLPSAVHLKAGGGDTAGAWTNMASRYPALKARSVVRRSATTLRTNEKTGETPSGQREDKEYG